MKGKRIYATIPRTFLAKLLGGTQTIQPNAHLTVTVQGYAYADVLRFTFKENGQVIWEADFYPVGSDTK